jgi:hypothetical protein
MLATREACLHQLTELREALPRYALRIALMHAIAVRYTRYEDPPRLDCAFGSLGRTPLLEGHLSGYVEVHSRLVL